VGPVDVAFFWGDGLLLAAEERLAPAAVYGVDGGATVSVDGAASAPCLRVDWSQELLADLVREGLAVEAPDRLAATPLDTGAGRLSRTTTS